MAKIAEKTTKITKTAVQRRTVKTPTPASENRVKAKDQIDNRLATLTDFRGERLREVRKLIHEVDPDVLEEWKWRGTPVWSNHGIYVLANAHKDKVKITFAHGAQLSDPKQLFNNGLDGKRWRAIDMHESYKLNQSAFKALLRQAIAYNRTQAASKSKAARTST